MECAWLSQKHLACQRSAGTIATECWCKSHITGGPCDPEHADERLRCGAPGPHVRAWLTSSRQSAGAALRAEWHYLVKIRYQPAGNRLPVEFSYEHSRWYASIRGKVPTDESHPTKQTIVLLARELFLATFAEVEKTGSSLGHQVIWLFRVSCRPQILLDRFSEGTHRVPAATGKH